MMAVQSVALAAQNMLLMAHAEGLGACWMCAPLFCPDVVRAALALPADWEAQALLTLGYPAEAADQGPGTARNEDWYGIRPSRIKVVALVGGVGGAKLAYGLSKMSIARPVDVDRQRGR